MKKKGFTLIELLAVIVILAVIALITTPMILNVIEESKKGALKDSAYGLMESADIYYAEHTIDGINKKTEFTFEEGIQTSVEQLGYKGRIEKGSLNLYSDGKVALCITDGKYAAIKNVNEEEVRISSGRCSYNEETEEYETVGICSDLESELEKVKEENNKKIEEIENSYRDQIEELNKRIEELEENEQNWNMVLLMNIDAEGFVATPSGSNYRDGFVPISESNFSNQASEYFTYNSSTHIFTALKDFDLLITDIEKTGGAFGVYKNTNLTLTADSQISSNASILLYNIQSGDQFVFAWKMITPVTGYVMTPVPDAALTANCYYIAK